MPFALSSDPARLWPDRNLNDAGKARGLLQPNPEDAIAFHRVGSRVSNARNQGAELIEALDEVKR
jgi:putative SOS response-associated peptidase YedK